MFIRVYTRETSQAERPCSFMIAQRRCDSNESKSLFPCQTHQHKKIHCLKSLSYKPSSKTKATECAVYTRVLSVRTGPSQQAAGLCSCSSESSAELLRQPPGCLRLAWTSRCLQGHDPASAQRPAATCCQLAQSIRLLCTTSGTECAKLAQLRDTAGARTDCPAA